MNKLQKIQDIQQPTPKTEYTNKQIMQNLGKFSDQAPVGAPRASATTLRMPKNYAIPPRVQTPSETQDATEFIYPERGIWNEQTKEPENPPIPKVQTENPRQLPQIQELLPRPKEEAGNLRSTPVQNTRSKTTQEQPIK